MLAGRSFCTRTHLKSSKFHGMRESTFRRGTQIQSAKSRLCPKPSKKSGLFQIEGCAEHAATESRRKMLYVRPCQASANLSFGKRIDCCQVSRLQSTSVGNVTNLQNEKGQCSLSRHAADSSSSQEIFLHIRNRNDRAIFHLTGFVSLRGDKSVDHDSNQVLFTSVRNKAKKTQKLSGLVSYGYILEYIPLKIENILQRGIIFLCCP